jgi:hypothetical protein
LRKKVLLLRKHRRSERKKEKEVERYEPTLPTREISLEKILIPPEEMETFTGPKEDPEEIQAVPLILFLILVMLLLVVSLKQSEPSEQMSESNPSPGFPDF